jgi:hypothetical protein
MVEVRFDRVTETRFRTSNFVVEPMDEHPAVDEVLALVWDHFMAVESFPERWLDLQTAAQDYSSEGRPAFVPLSQRLAPYLFGTAALILTVLLLWGDRVPRGWPRG